MNIRESGNQPGANVVSNRVSLRSGQRGVRRFGNFLRRIGSRRDLEVGLATKSPRRHRTFRHIAEPYAAVLPSLANDRVDENYLGGENKFLNVHATENCDVRSRVVGGPGTSPPESAAIAGRSVSNSSSKSVVRSAGTVLKRD